MKLVSKAFLLSFLIAFIAPAALSAEEPLRTHTHRQMVVSRMENSKKLESKKSEEGQKEVARRGKSRHGRSLMMRTRTRGV